jgi:hypothetical protein
MATQKDPNLMKLMAENEVLASKLYALQYEGEEEIKPVQMTRVNPTKVRKPIQKSRNGFRSVRSSMMDDLTDNIGDEFEELAEVMVDAKQKEENLKTIDTSIWSFLSQGVLRTFENSPLGAAIKAKRSYDEFVKEKKRKKMIKGDNASKIIEVLVVGGAATQLDQLKSLGFKGAPIYSAVNSAYKLMPGTNKQNLLTTTAVGVKGTDNVKTNYVCVGIQSQFLGPLWGILFIGSWYITWKAGMFFAKSMKWMASKFDSLL